MKKIKHNIWDRRESLEQRQQWSSIEMGCKYWCRKWENWYYWWENLIREICSWSRNIKNSWSVVKMKKENNWGRIEAKYKSNIITEEKLNKIMHEGKENRQEGIEDNTCLQDMNKLPKT